MCINHTLYRVVVRVSQIKTCYKNSLWTEALVSFTKQWMWSTRKWEHTNKTRLTLIRIGWGEDGAVLPLHLLDFLCQRLDETPDLFHLLGQGETESRSTLDRLALTGGTQFIVCIMLIGMEPLSKKRPNKCRVSPTHPRLSGVHQNIFV